MKFTFFFFMCLVVALFIVPYIPSLPREQKQPWMMRDAHASSVCKSCIKSVAEQCTTQERTLYERDYGCNKDQFDVEDPTNEWISFTIGEFGLTEQFLQNPLIQQILKPMFDFFGIDPSTFRIVPPEIDMNLNAVSFCTQASIQPNPNIPTGTYDTPFGPFYIDGTGFLAQFYHAIGHKRQFDVNPRGSMRVEVDISTQFIGFENHPFCGEGQGPKCDIVPNYLDDYRLGAIQIAMNDALGLNPFDFSLTDNPQFYQNFKQSLNNNLGASFILTQTGVWVVYGAGHSGTPGNPLYRMTPLGVAVKFIRYYTEQNILKLGIEWDSQCHQIRFYVDGDLVQVIYEDEIGLPQKLVERPSNKWQWAFYDQLDLLESIDNLNPQFVAIQSGMNLLWARNGKALAEDTAYDHMPGLVLDFPVGRRNETLFQQGQCVAADDSDFWYISTVCSNNTNADPSDDYVLPDIFYDWDQKIKYSLYGIRHIFRDNCDSCCKNTPLQDISDQDFLML